MNHTETVRAYLNQRRGVTLNAARIAEDLRMPGELVREILDSLTKQGVVLKREMGFYKMPELGA